MKQREEQAAGGRNRWGGSGEATGLGGGTGVRDDSGNQGRDKRMKGKGEVGGNRIARLSAKELRNMTQG